MSRPDAKRLAVDLSLDMHNDLVEIAKKRRESITKIVKRLIYTYIIEEIKRDAK